jgi:Leucine-rich repeat (LRR) protein
MNKDTDKVEVKYTVYKNDLKFRKHRNIVKKLAIFENDDTKDHYEINMDTINYRIEESKNNDYTCLDLSNLELTYIPDFKHDKNYDKLKNIKYLFINNNKIGKISDNINQFPNLEVLDISSNNLLSIDIMPLKLLELTCHNNKLTEICSSNTLTKLDCSFNEILKLNNYNNLFDLLCNNNKLININTFSKINRIICKNNPIINISSQPLVTYLDCSATNLTKINNMANIKHFLCNETNISDVSNLLSVETLEIINSKVEKLHFLPKLKQILYINTQNILINSKYKISEELTERNHCLAIFKQQ